MAGVSKLVDEGVMKESQQQFKELGNDGVSALKLRAIISVYTHGVTKVSEIFGISRGALTQWITRFKAGGLEAIKSKPGRGRKSKLSAEQKAIVKDWLCADHKFTIQAMQIKIKEHFLVELGRTAVNRLMHEVGFSYITPRPEHHKKTPALVEEFKKKSKGDIRNEASYLFL